MRSPEELDREIAYLGQIRDRCESYAVREILEHQLQALRWCRGAWPVSPSARYLEPPIGRKMTELVTKAY